MQLCHLPAAKLKPNCQLAEVRYALRPKAAGSPSGAFGFVVAPSIAVNWGRAKKQHSSTAITSKVVPSGNFRLNGSRGHCRPYQPFPAKEGSQVPGGATTLLGIAMAVALGLVLAVVLWKYARLWLRALVSRARIGLPSLVSMSLRRVNPGTIVDAKVMAVQAGLDGIDKQGLESHQLAGGRVTNVVRALIAANRAHIDLDWDTAAAIDLAGRDVLDAVRMSVDPRVIDCPDPEAPGSNTLDGVAQDGIQLKVKARVTVRANLAQLVGGAAEETVVARVGEGIVSAIGSCEDHKTVLSNPMLISQRVLNRGLDAQTAFAIVSIDIANVDVGDNIGARLQIDQAQADMRVARAKAEERRARAVAEEQEMIARTRENQARVVAAEAQIPRAQADAFRKGNIGRRGRLRNSCDRRPAGARAIGVE